MLVLIDDSGDPGFKVGRGSSRYFVISLVIFDDFSDAEDVAKKINNLKKKIGWKIDQEFKFANTRKDIRESFFREINSSKFRIRCLVVEKESIYSKKLQSDKKSFYAFFIKKVLENNNGTIQTASIKIDGSGDRLFKMEFLSYLRRELNSNGKDIVKKIKLVDSASDVLIQLADMVAGAIHRSYYEEKDDRLLYRGIIKKHIEDEWEFK